MPGITNMNKAIMRIIKCPLSQKNHYVYIAILECYHITLKKITKFVIVIVAFTIKMKNSNNSHLCNYSDRINKYRSINRQVMVLQTVMIVGAGKGGTSILKILHETDVLIVKSVIDYNLEAPGISLAKELGIAIGNDWSPFLTAEIDIVIEVTGNEKVFREIQELKSPNTVLIPGSVAFLITKLIEEKEELIAKFQNETYKFDTMLGAVIQSSDEAISVVDENGRGTIINPAYTRLTGLTRDQVIGKPATADISEGESMHMQVLRTQKAVRGVAMRLGPNKKEVIVNVAPIIVNGKLKGSVGVIHDVSEIKTLNRELNRVKQIMRTIQAKYSFDDIIGNGDEMKLAIQQAKLAARTPATILLRGESGTGKELFAHAIHNGSERKYNKFIRVNCAAISESLLESELFGYEEGAFSGAKKGGKKGLFEEANEGSIFLDEIAELSANTQAKLLRVLQENEIIRVGGTKPISINVRIIAATNFNLEKGIANGTFREDLYYRLNRMPIHIPPLRERIGDIPLLVNRLIKKINQDYGRNVEGITPAAMRQLMLYHWPGNVRELENILGRAIIFVNYHESHIDTGHLPDLNGNILPSKKLDDESIEVKEDRTLTELLDQYERSIILQTLEKMNGNKTECAKALGLSVRNLYYKLDKHQIAKNGTQFSS